MGKVLRMPVTWFDRCCAENGLGLGVEAVSKSRLEMLVACTVVETVEGQEAVSIL